MSALQAFTAGAALCSTSLGTTFTVLTASGLTATKLGVVLTSAAMLDDVVGLIMVQVISNLGASSSGTFSIVIVIRPVVVSLGFALIVPLIARYVAKPFTYGWREYESRANPKGYVAMMMSNKNLPVVIHMIILIALVTSATYAGTSGLFAAYLAGVSISWWDSDLPDRPHHSGVASNQHNSVSSTQTSEYRIDEPTTRTTSIPQPDMPPRNDSGIEVFDRYYKQPLQRILKPFFFASIGFSIPITEMFSSTVVWKGIIYTVLMMFGKFVCGLWLIRVPGLASRVFGLAGRTKPPTRNTKQKDTAAANNAEPDAPVSVQDASKQIATESGASQQEPPSSMSVPTQSQSTPNTTTEATTCNPSEPPNQPSVGTTPKPISLYPGLILGSAMIARGEIGFLISALAESNGVYGSEPNGQLFLVVTWAIMLCTIVGPLMVGLFVRRVKRLEGKIEDASRGDVLGVWGVE